MANECKKIWTYKEAKGLIEVYKARKDEYFRTRNKKEFWQNILTDLEAMDMLVSHTTPEQVIAKWKCLLRAYKCAKDRGTGTGPSKFSYLDEMDEVFDRSPIINCPHSILVGATPMIIPEIEPVQSPTKVCNQQPPEQPSTSKRNKCKRDELIAIKKEYYKRKIEEQKNRTLILTKYLEEKEKARVERMKMLLNYLNKQK